VRRLLKTGHEVDAENSGYGIPVSTAEAASARRRGRLLQLVRQRCSGPELVLPNPPGRRPPKHLTPWPQCQGIPGLRVRSCKSHNGYFRTDCDEVDGIVGSGLARGFWVHPGCIPSVVALCCPERLQEYLHPAAAHLPPPTNGWLTEAGMVSSSFEGGPVT